MEIESDELLDVTDYNAFLIICHAVWECQPTERHLIIERIVHHVCLRHLALSPSDVKVVAGQLDFAVSVRGKGK